ncbi:peptidylprolyl isomerase [Pelagerythrobacter rhizovicinus]|uniref:Parvulin-like PPIase n=1 Tax=Pelagerythrobacter rhizovicinus TaxID=2268576 RepID=A0A4Q2KND2_9SPHN|nr:peptidylprolyl isomerase [Pelagerythrobacter rhizovicinus]RXZ66059.1 peptidylprolyl isomerase [Pelagerythrobacter rhizovicinus]
MLQFFRNFFQSKLGVPVTLAFLALIAIAFASSDVANTGTFGGIAGGDRVAVVGDRKIDSADLVGSAQAALEQARQSNPNLSMNAFIEQGGLDDVLDQMIDRAAIAEYARRHGLRAGENLVNSEILAIPQFRGADGEFDAAVFRQLIGAQGISEAAFRADLTQGLLAQQLLVPMAFGAKATDKVVARYAALLKERRRGAIAVLPSQAFAPTGDPSQAALETYYTENRGDFIRPERRVIRYAVIDADALGGQAEPTAAEIRARYEENSAQYAAREDRRITQLIVPTQEAANAIRARVEAGGSLEAAAREAGFGTAALGPVSQEDLAEQSSPQVASAVFAAGRGELATPARSGLGWHVVRVDQIDATGARPLDQVRGEIAEALRTEKRQTALADLAANVEDQLADGISLADVARDLEIETRTTRPLLASGGVYDTPNETAPEVLAPTLETAFQMSEGQPQIAEIERGRTFLIFEASQITPSAAAPLAEIRDDVIAGWRQAQGAEAARAAADRVLKRVRGGATLASAIGEEEQDLPSIEQIDLTREQLAALQGRFPAPIALLFSMAEGTTKKLEAPDDNGWFVVDLDDIETGEVNADDPVFAQARTDIGGTMGREYIDQFRLALRKELGIERNETAIEAVRKQLLGQN